MLRIICRKVFGQFETIVVAIFRRLPDPEFFVVAQAINTNGFSGGFLREVKRGDVGIGAEHCCPVGNQLSEIADF